MNVKIDPEWREALAQEWESPYFEQLAHFVKSEYAGNTVFPAPGRIFAAFDACPLSKVKVVIIGQDPYHGPGQANGLCFAVPDGIALPPSLVNIFKEVRADMGVAPDTPMSGDLTRWARQGVLLLNATLTVRAHQAASHQGHGWETFTDAVIRTVSSRCENVVFLLWGSYAIRKGALVDRTRHLVLESPHPSPLSAHRGFFGNRHFSRANDYLTAHGKAPVNWL